jgi:eukaryotic-like serine/threonine-protein kinase
MVLELMERDMRSFLRTDARTASLQSRVSLGLGALSGILYLHSQVPPVVHRDIKPENLLLSHGDSRVKVCDLGLARNKHGVFLQTVHHGGTLSYVAPEVHRGSDVDERCDMYALAVVLWELVTLGVPFADKPPQSIPGIVGTHFPKSALQWFYIVDILGHSLGEFCVFRVL